MSALAAASWRSAMRISGRLRSRLAGSPTATLAGGSGSGAGVASVASSAPGSCPVSTANWSISTVMSARLGAIAFGLGGLAAGLRQRLFRRGAAGQAILGQAHQLRIDCGLLVEQREHRWRARNET
jgi:hypothetical protein